MISDGFSDSGTAADSVICHNNPGYNGLASGLHWSLWTLRRRLEASATQRLETVRDFLSKFLSCS